MMIILTARERRGDDGAPCSTACVPVGSTAVAATGAPLLTGCSVTETGSPPGRGSAHQRRTMSVFDTSTPSYSADESVTSTSGSSAGSPDPLGDGTIERDITSWRSWPLRDRRTGGVGTGSRPRKGRTTSTNGIPPSRKRRREENPVVVMNRHGDARGSTFTMARAARRAARAHSQNPSCETCLTGH